MCRVRPFRFAAYVLVATAAGCAQSSPLLSRGTTVGTLKTSVSHLQFENDQLRRKVASLESDNRQIEQRLVQEETANGELTARLDDARALLGQRGLGQADEGVSEPGSAAIRRMLPTGQSSRKRRKPPFAKIPGQLDALAPAEESDSAAPWGSRKSGRRGEAGGLGDQSRLDGFSSWLPVAHDITDSSSTRR